MWPSSSLHAAFGETPHLAHGQTCNPPEAWGSLIPAPPKGILKGGETAHTSLIQNMGIEDILQSVNVALISKANKKELNTLIFFNYDKISECV